MSRPTTTQPSRRGQARTLRVAACGLGVVVLCGAGLLLAPAAGAAPEVVLAQAQSIEDVLNNIRNLIMSVLITLGVIALSLAGLFYLLSGGDQAMAMRAKAALYSAAVGFALAALAPLVINILAGVVELR